MYKKILSLSLAAAIILSSAATAVIPAYAADENPMGISSPTTGESSMKPEGGQDQGGTDQGGQEQEQGTWKVSFTGIERPFEYNTGNFRFPEYYTLKKKVVAWKNTVTGEEFKVGESHTPISDETYTPVWEDLAEVLKATFVDSNGETKTVDFQEDERGAFIIYPEPTSKTGPNGEVFIGWRRVGGDENSHIGLPGEKSYTNTLEYEAVWGTEKDLERTITFDANGGTGKQASMTVKVNEIFEMPECTFTAPEGKIFIGWKDQWDNICLPGDGRRVSKNMSFTAVWGTEKDLERTITFDAGEGSGKQASMTIKVNERFEMPECTFTAPEGKIFIGWKDQWDNICLPGDGRRARENMSFTAVWGTEKDLERTITFDAGEGSGKQASMTVKVNERFEVPKCTMTAPEGKQFLYWINEHNGHILFPGDEYGTNMNLKFTAVWGTEKDLERTVTPDANGGTGEMKPFIVKMNERFKVPECTFTAPEGKIFLYWLDPAGRKMYEHQEWGTYADMKMTAQWGTEADLEKCTITFDANGGTGKQASMTALEGKLFKLPSCTLTAPAGMEFKCWVDEYGREFNPGDQRWTNTSITLYAKWVKTEKPEPQPQPEPQPEVKPEPTPAQKKEEAKKAEAQRQEEEKKTVTEATDKVLDEISKLEIKADNKTNNKTEEKQEVLTVELKNVTEVKAETFAEVAKEAEKKNAKVEVKVDNVVGKKVVARITFDAAEAAKLKEPVKLGVKTDKAATKVVNNTFTKFFDNEIAVAKCEQEGKFGMNVRMAVKVNLEKLNKETLAFYSYDAKTNTFKKIKEPKYVVDKNGYVHFDTNLAGSIVITDKPLTLKKAK